MKIRRGDDNGGLTVITGENYEATVIPERFIVLLRSGKHFYYGMCLLSAIDTLKNKDKASEPPKIAIDDSRDGTVILEITTDSNIWERKIHRYIFKDEAIEYSTIVHGQGEIDRAHYFRGVFKETEIASLPGFTKVLSPQANFIEKQEFHVNEFQSIGAGNYKEVCDSVWGFALHGGPLCYVCREEDDGTLMSIGILAKAGDYTFKAFEMNYLSEKDKKE
ncbi:MAG: hypothetical protein KAG97_12945, partial [Victivallales bacterium]|nr:hypothetical protein [Victivallales bacterium]